MNWTLITDDPASLPAMGAIVFLFEDGRGVFVGSRDDTGDGWLWGNSHGAFWWNGAKYDAEVEQDDDYKPTHWCELPTPPRS